MQNSLISNSRLPLDHFISGSLIAGIGAGAINLNDLKNGKINSKIYTKKVIKSALSGGVATGVAIYASNCIANRNFIKASIAVVSGVLVLNLITNSKDKI